MNRKIRNHIIGHMILVEFWLKDMQITFLQELIIISKKKRSYAKVIYKKIDDFFLSQNVDLVYR